MNEMELLNSSDSRDILRALFHIGSIKKEIKQETIQKLQGFVEHEDAEVREQVVSTVGVRLRLKEFFPDLWRRLNGEEQDVSTLIALVDAVTALVYHGCGDKKELANLLLQYIQNPLCDDELRGSAYLALLRLFDKISVIDYAKSPRKFSEINISKNLLCEISDSI